MSTHLIGSNIEFSVVDKRRATLTESNADTLFTGRTIFTTNAGGTTTTLVGASVDYSANGDDNAVRIGDQFRLFDSSDNPKDANTVFEITGVTDDDAGTATVTFSPAASVATASGDVAKLASVTNYGDPGSMDIRLQELDASTYTQGYLDSLTTNDKIYALRLLEGGGSI